MTEKTTNDIYSMLSGKAEPEDNDKLGKLSELCEKLRAADDVVAQKKRELQDAVDAFRELANYAIPEHMRDINVSEVKLTDGAVVSCKPYYIARIADGANDAFVAWLIEHEQDDIVKTTVGAEFSRTDRDKAKEVLEQLRTVLPDAGGTLVLKEAVHWKTLESWFKSRYELGEELPPIEILNQEVGYVAKIKGARR